MAKSSGMAVEADHAVGTCNGGSNYSPSVFSQCFDPSSKQRMKEQNYSITKRQNRSTGVNWSRKMKSQERNYCSRRKAEKTALFDSLLLVRLAVYLQIVVDYLTTLSITQAIHRQFIE